MLGPWVWSGPPSSVEGEVWGVEGLGSVGVAVGGSVGVVVGKLEPGLVVGADVGGVGSVRGL